MRHADEKAFESLAELRKTAVELENQGPRLQGWLAPTSYGWQWTPDARIDPNASAISFLAFTIRGQNAPGDIRIDDVVKSEGRRVAEAVLSVQNNVQVNVERVDDLCVFGFYVVTRNTFDWATVGLLKNGNTGRYDDTMLTHRDGRTFQGRHVMSWPVDDGQTPRFKVSVLYGPIDTGGIQFKFTVIERL